MLAHQARPERLPGGQLPHAAGTRSAPSRRSTGATRRAPHDILELIVQPQQARDVPTFRYEMRQIYRVAGADLDASTLAVGITPQPSERPLAGPSETYLQQLGLSMPSDATLFDRTTGSFPGRSDPDAAIQVVKDAYIVFPHLHALRRRHQAHPGEASDSLYRTPLYLLLSAGTAGQVLRAAALRRHRRRRPLHPQPERPPAPRGERAALRRRPEARCGGSTTSISYDLGQVTFLNPDALFGQGSAQVTARFEERGTLRRGAHQRSWARHPVLARRARRHQPHRDVPEGAERLHPARARLRGDRQPHRRDQHRAPLQADRHQPFPQQLDTQAGDRALPARCERRDGLHQSGSQPDRARRSSRTSKRRPAWWSRCARPRGSSAASPRARPDSRTIGFADGFRPDDAVALTWQNLVPRHPAIPTRSSSGPRTSTP